MATREQLLQYWTARLDESRRRAFAKRTLSAWQWELYAKVLGYLVSRYGDARCWSTFAPSPLPRPDDLVDPDAAERVSLVIRAVTGPGTPPKSTVIIRSFLNDIHQNNAASYVEYGLSRMYESN